MPHRRQLDKFGIPSKTADTNIQMSFIIVYNTLNSQIVQSILSSYLCDKEL